MTEVMANRYRIPTQLCGTVRIGKDGGQWNNQVFSYRLTDDQHDQIYADRWELIQFAKSKTKAKRPQEIPGTAAFGPLPHPRAAELERLLSLDSDVDDLNGDDSNPEVA